MTSTPAIIITKPTVDTKVGLTVGEDGGLKVMALADGGLAAASGLMLGDTLLTMNGEAFDTASGLTEKLKATVGDVKFSILPRATEIAPEPSRSRVVKESERRSDLA